MKSFGKFLKTKFQVSKACRFNLNMIGCTIARSEDGSIKLSQKDKLNELDPQILLHAVRGDKDQAATEKKATSYRSIIRKMIFIDRMSMPTMLMHA